MNRRKLSPEHEAYLASVAHLKDYFDFQRVRPFTIPATSTKVDPLLVRHNIPAEMKEDIYRVFGYVYMQYTVDFKRDKAKWEEEREIYTKPETKDGLDLYYNMNRLPYWEAIESITFEVKPGWSYGNTPEKTLKVSYPEMIRFMVEAIRNKRDSWDKNENKELFFAEESEKLDRHTDNDDWYKAEVEVHRLLHPWWRDKENKRLKKYRRTKKSLANYEVLRKKKTIEELYYYLKDKVDFPNQEKLYGFVAELLYTAGVPFVQKEKYKPGLESYDVVIMEITAQIKSAISALKE